VTADHALVGDASLTLEALLEEVRTRLGGDSRGRFDSVVAEIEAVREEWLAEWRPKLTSDEVPNHVRHLFLDHLADWWDEGFDRFRRSRLAEFTNDNWRGRSTTRYFKKGELR